MDKKFCHSCGSENTLDSRFCVSCGTELLSVEPEEESVEPIVTEESTEPIVTEEPIVAAPVTEVAPPPVPMMTPPPTMVAPPPVPGPIPNPGMAAPVVQSAGSGMAFRVLISLCFVLYIACFFMPVLNGDPYDLGRDLVGGYNYYDYGYDFGMTISVSAADVFSSLYSYEAGPALVVLMLVVLFSIPTLLSAIFALANKPTPTMVLGIISGIIHTLEGIVGVVITSGVASYSSTMSIGIAPILLSVCGILLIVFSCIYGVTAKKRMPIYPPGPYGMVR